MSTDLVARDDGDRVGHPAPSLEPVTFVTLLTFPPLFYMYP